MRKIASILISIIGLVAILYLVVENYSFLFAKTVTGVVYGVERVDLNMAVIAADGAKPNAQMFSYAVAIKDDKTGEIVTASSEDRRWAVVKKDQCAEVKFLPYPPWSISRSGAFFGARLIKLYECPVNPR